MKHTITMNTICSIVFNRYRLILKQAVNGQHEYWFYDGSFLVKKYPASEKLKSPIGMMGSVMITALDDLERKEKEQCTTK